MKDKKQKLLFFHFDLGGGGAEKVLVNLVNNLDPEKYDITLQTIFGKGKNRNLLGSHVKFKCLFNCKARRGTRILFKLFPPRLLYKLLVHDKYDIEIAFLELIPTRIVGGSSNRKSKKYAWIHNTTTNINSFTSAFRNINEFYRIYSKFNKLAFVSEGARESFYKMYSLDTPSSVVHNVLDTSAIIEMSKEPINIELENSVVNLCSVGRLCEQKGYDRLLRVLKRVSEEGERRWHLYLIGEGEDKLALVEQAKKLGIDNNVTLVGFQQNPHKYVSKMDLFVCSSLKEGYSTAVTESLILGIPVITTDCSGMDELIGDSKAGIIVENNEESLKNGILQILSNENILLDLKSKAKKRSNFYSTENCINEFESFIGCYSN